PGFDVMSSKDRRVDLAHDADRCAVDDGPGPACGVQTGEFRVLHGRFQEAKLLGEHQPGSHRRSGVSSGQHHRDVFALVRKKLTLWWWQEYVADLPQRHRQLASCLIA